MFDIEKLKASHELIIYGAGVLGKQFLLYLLTNGVPAEKMFVWDMNYMKIDSWNGIKILKPDFEGYTGSRTNVVIVAVSYNPDSQLPSDITRQFLNCGFTNVVHYTEVAGIREYVTVGSFKSTEYESSIFENNIDFSSYKPLVKPIAFYLPQFHEIPENNEWWGEGFTEWTNTKKAKPKFQGHYQPREPHPDFGYYDLSDVSNIRKQVELAKQHGIYGFAFYYYWFSGRKLLTTPIDLLHTHKDIDMNYCLMWCNEPWTKHWVGDNNDVLVDNDYTDNDPEIFISDLLKYMVDDRYIRIDGKPVILVYKLRSVPDARRTINKWREHARSLGIGEICVISQYGYENVGTNELGLDDCVDCEAEFQGFSSSTIPHVILRNEEGDTLSYAMATYKNCIDSHIGRLERVESDRYLSCFCGFDNAPRYDAGFFSYVIDFSIKDFYDYVNYLTKKSLMLNKEFLFVFAWNEWAESACLEPDKKYGYSLINTFSKAICDIPF